jgi:hypothetical protein
LIKKATFIPPIKRAKDFCLWAFSFEHVASFE